MRSPFCVVLFSMLALSAHAQTPAPPPGVVKSVEVKGNRNYATADILRQSGLKTGERASPATLEQARQKIQSTELFNTVSFEFRFTRETPAQYDVTFTVVEDPQLFPMHFERLGADDAAIRAYLKAHVPMYSDRISGTEGVLRRYKEAVQQFLAERDSGKEHPKVKVNVSSDENQQLRVMFFPDAPIPTIAQVQVSGNQAVDTGTILRAVNEVAIGAPLTDARVKMILNGSIKPVYAAKGYALVTFPKVESEPAKNNLGMILKVQIKEGPAFNFGSIRFRGRGLEEDEIRSAIGFKPGEVFNSEKVDSFRLDLVHRMKQRGLLDANITADTEPDEAKHVVNVVYNVLPGDVYNFRTLDIEGLDITSQPVIAKLWGEKAGKPFNPDYPDFFLKRVQEQGLFDNLSDTRSDYTADSTSHDVTVHLYFKGGKSAEDKKREKKAGFERHDNLSGDDT